MIFVQQLLYKYSSLFSYVTVYICMAHAFPRVQANAYALRTPGRMSNFFHVTCWCKCWALVTTTRHFTPTVSLYVHIYACRCSLLMFAHCNCHIKCFKAIVIWLYCTHILLVWYSCIASCVCMILYFICTLKNNEKHLWQAKRSIRRRRRRSSRNKAKRKKFLAAAYACHSLKYLPYKCVCAQLLYL